MSASKPILIVGGGVIGLSIAWRLVRRGQPVVVLERDRVGQHASRVAAGMLAAAAEVGYEEPELYQLCRASLQAWPGFAAELEAESGLDLDYRSFGTLVVADDRDAAAALRRGYAFQQAQGYPVQWLSGAEALDLEPMLSPRIVAAVSVPEDHAVDNRALLTALEKAIRKHGGQVREGAQVERLDTMPDAAAVVLAAGERLEGSRIVMAAGAWTSEIKDWPGGTAPSIRPVKGQILELQTRPPFQLRHVVRGRKAYMVPRSDGRLIVGATSEEMGFDPHLTVGGIHGIMDGAWEMVPGVLDQYLLSVDVGFRPASRDHQPLIGFTADPRIFLATGHYRHGIVLSAVTALASERMLLDGVRDETVVFFDPSRRQTRS
ncbi:MAG: glycine oxidase ThiO [Bacteroidetes bacterium]|nr:glycine oxidase ThiO [Bacteroidota bacterium]